jgi:hypothetical protein
MVIVTDQPQTTERQEDPADANLIVRHLIVALERATAGRWTAAQRNVEYAASRLYCAFGPRLPLSDEEASDA